MRLGVFAIDFDPDLFTRIGFESVVFPFNTSREILKTAEREFEVFIEFKPFEGGIIENIFGEKSKLGALGCPSDEKTRDKNLSKLENIPYDVILDFIRFPSPSNGRYFYSCFCKNCSRKAKELGYDLSVIKDKVKEYLETDNVDLLEEWFDFKRDLIKDYLEYSGLKRAFFFTPSLSFLVGQSYEFELTCIHPMIYPEPIGSACIEYELAYMKGELKSRVMENLGVVDDQVIRTELEKAINISKSRIEPIITISENIEERIKMVERAEKIYIFAYSKDKRALFEKLVRD